MTHFLFSYPLGAHFSSSQFLSLPWHIIYCEKVPRDDWTNMNSDSQIKIPFSKCLRNGYFWSTLQVKFCVAYFEDFHNILYTGRKPRARWKWIWSYIYAKKFPWVNLNTISFLFAQLWGSLSPLAHDVFIFISCHVLQVLNCENFHRSHFSKIYIELHIPFVGLLEMICGSSNLTFLLPFCGKR